MKWLWKKDQSEQLTTDSQLDGPETLEKKWTTNLRIGVLIILLIAFGIVALAITLFFAIQLFTDDKFGQLVINKMLDALPTIASVALVMFGFKGALKKN